MPCFPRFSTSSLFHFHGFRYNSEGNTEGQCERFDIIQQDLEGRSEITHEYAMDILEKVYQYISPTVFTDWSVIYYQTDFTMDVATNRDFDTVYHLEPKDFN